MANEAMLTDPVSSSDHYWRTEEIIVGTWTFTLELGWVLMDRDK